MTAILCMLAGAGIGAGVALALYVLGGCVEILNCACQIATCNCEGDSAMPGIWNGDTFLHVLLFCVIGGAIIGLIVGLCKMKAAADEETAKRNFANSEEAKRQREKWAGQVKQRALQVTNSCDQNKSIDKTIVSTNYKSSSLMKEIMKEFSNISEIQGKVNSIAKELTKKGE